MIPVPQGGALWCLSISHVVDIRRVAFLPSLDRPVLPSTPVEDEWVVWGCAVRSTPAACAANPQFRKFWAVWVGGDMGRRERFELSVIVGNNR